MGSLWLVCSIIMGHAAQTAFARDSSSIFRPLNVTTQGYLAAIYPWVGSYYNGTAKLEFTMGDQLTSWDNKSILFNDESCTNYHNKTIHLQELDSIFAVISPADDSVSNPVNMVWGLWPPNFNFSSSQNAPYWTSRKAEGEDGRVRWSLESISEYFSNYTRYQNISEIQCFPLEMNKTTQAPYNISASLASGYMPLGPLDVPSCNEAGRLETSTFNFWELRRNTVINFQFDSKTLNATVYANGTDMVINMDKKISGVLKITMTGVIDPWHSDFLSDNSTTPSWKRTVGYDENYYGYDFSSGAMSRNSETAVSIAAALFSTVLMLI